MTLSKNETTFMRNTLDNWHECFCKACGNVYRLPQNADGTLPLWAMSALMIAYGEQHKDCGEAQD